MHATKQRAMVMPDGSIQARPMMYLALSYDHRLVDGKEAVTFLVRVKEALEDPERLLLDQPVLGALFDVVFMAATDGRMLAHVERGRPSQELPSIADRDYFRASIEKFTGATPEALKERQAGNVEKLLRAVDPARATLRRQAFLGGAAACFAWAPEQTALPAKFVLRAGTGTGVVVSQLYAR